MAQAPDQIDRVLAAKGIAPETTAVVPGSAQDPFYHSTGQYKNVTLPDGTVVNALDVGSTKPPPALEIGMVSAASGLTITGTERNMYNERQAMNQGMTIEYIASRGGINSQGYFNDTPLSGQLTADEMKSVMKPDGSVDTQKQVDILIKKQYDEYITKGLPVEYALGQLKNQWGTFYSTTLLPKEAQGVTPVSLGLGSSGGSTSGSMGGTSATSYLTSGAPGNEMWWSVLKSKLAMAGIPTSTINKSYDYFKNILTDFDMSAGSETLDVIVDQFFTQSEYKSKTGQVFTSPYYQDFGKFNANLTRPKLPAELVPLVLGYKDLGAKYKISEAYLTDDSITKYLQNDVSIAEFDDRLNTAALKAQIADPQYVSALIKLGYINDASQLNNFFLDPNIGTNEMKNRQKNAAFVTEAVRRATPETQLQVDLEFAKQQAARYASQGYTEAQIASLAGTGYENIAQALPTGTKLAGIYDKEFVKASQKATPTETAAAMASNIQSQLQQEEFMNMTSSQIRALKEREVRAFQGASGVGSLRSSSAGAF
jgi:hypothetical protein